MKLGRTVSCVPSASHRKFLTVSPSTFRCVLHPEIDNQNSFCRPRLPLRWTFRLEFSEHLNPNRTDRKYYSAPFRGGKIHFVSKKVPAFKLSVTLSNLNRFSKFLHCWKAYEIRYKTQSTLPASP